MSTLNPIQLNKKNKRIYIIINFFVFLLFFIFIIFASSKIVFPSQFFDYSFANINSMKNTISDLSQKEKKLTFFASTFSDFSNIKISITLDSVSTSKLNNQKISIKKSFKAFFYPESSSIEDLTSREENSLVIVGDSVLIVGNKKKSPIDDVSTFESLGYNWKNLKSNNSDLSTYEEQKLINIHSAHPTGTILKTIENSQYYFIEDFTKKRILNPSASKIENPISISEKSLTSDVSCILEKSFFNKNKYYCDTSISELKSLSGKDYLFTIDNLPSDTKIKKLSLEFKKSADTNNFRLFLSELKNKVLNRFGVTSE